MKRLKDFTYSHLEEQCDLIYALKNIVAVENYLKLVAKRDHGIVSTKVDAKNDGAEYRQALLQKYLDL